MISVKMIRELQSKGFTADQIAAIAEADHRARAVQRTKDAERKRRERADRLVQRTSPMDTPASPAPPITPLNPSTPTVGLGGGDAPAREPAIRLTQDAIAFSVELASIAGYSPEFLPPLWMSASPAMRVQMMLDAGWQIPMMREQATIAMRKKRDGAPGTIRYFEPIFARAHAQGTLPLPPVTISTTEAHHGQAPATDWQSSRDAFRRARAKLEAYVARAGEAQEAGGDRDGKTVSLGAAARHR